MQMRDDRSDARAVQRISLVVLAIPLVLVAGLCIVQGVADPFRRVAFAAVVAVNGLLVLGVANGRLSLRAAGPWVVLSPTAILVARLLVWEALMRRADLALYAAQSDGRDRVVGVGDEPLLKSTEHAAGTDGAHQQT
jgi:hypothetical protein